MSIRVALRHHTQYQYDRQVPLAPHVVRLRPAPHAQDRVAGYSLNVSPGNHFLNWQQDPWGNYLARLVFPEPCDHFSIDVEVLVDMVAVNPFDFFLDDEAKTYPFHYAPEVRADLKAYLEVEDDSPALRRWLQGVDRSDSETVNFLVALNQRLAADIQYTLREEVGVQTPAETLSRRAGSCRDSAWLLVQALRLLGLASRFVSGYLVQLVEDEVPVGGPAGPSADFTDLHAWTEVYLPGAGWVGLDPTSGLMAGEGHIALACAPHYRACAPVEGRVGACEVQFEFNNEVYRIEERPRVTRPYTDASWQAVNQLAAATDARLEGHDVRLTMGGEPTFVSRHSPDADEWNTSALGPEKRALGEALLWRMRDQFASTGLVHHGQGKWYPGEQLPRWALSLTWRRDGVPIWQDPGLLADPLKPQAALTPEIGAAFLTVLAARLEVTSAHILPGFEDGYYYLWREGTLPTNVDPFDSQLKDPLERDRLRRVFEGGLARTVGHVLPLAPTRNGWQSAAWRLRRERMYLVPGDSPMGYRLPLPSLPWRSDAGPTHAYGLDPMTEPAPIGFAPVPRSSNVAARHTARTLDADAAHRALSQGLHDPEWGLSAPNAVGPASATAKGPGPSTGDIPHSTAGSRPPGSGSGSGSGSNDTRPEPALQNEKSSRKAPSESVTEPTPGVPVIATLPDAWPEGFTTAVVAEVRDNVLHIFLPPIEVAEKYLELVATIEATAAELDRPVVLEGYPPPWDPRLVHMAITPDPGVIEVNVHPSANWSELRHVTETLYEEARQLGLASEKFMLDGRHSGTGGGNHVVMGGATPADSPFLRRPDVLKSLLTFWQNHPSLSYLFSGLFIGPTSQAPRVDEARDDNLYELETALTQIQPGVQTAPWKVDRLLRNHLIDLTGNTHRAEFCIDKLFEPGASAARRGLVELRALEMPPHPQMSLVQALLVRSLIAHFWETPWQGGLIRYGTALHDKFMLPFFNRVDFRDVLATLQHAGFAFEPDWFEPFFEFRFPLLGELAARGVHIQLRTALEPWHVLGEESSVGGTARYVDSSVERVEVRVSGLVPETHAVAVNGFELPLHPTGTNGEYVAGVRFKAWDPASALHPEVPATKRLTVDLVDRRLLKSEAGCCYFVAHPGGLSYERLPVNAREAESRRRARFWPQGHSQGRVALYPAPRTPEYPHTLDLRRAHALIAR